MFYYRLFILPLFFFSCSVSANVLLDLREKTQQLFEQTKPPQVEVSQASIDLIVRWEIGTREAYNRRYQWPIYPGGASGPTIGIGYDLGHQTPTTILNDWFHHQEKQRLSTGSGITGPKSRDWNARHRDVLTPFDYAMQVFIDIGYPVYYLRAERAFGKSFSTAPEAVRGALTSLVYNRGGSMSGDRRREMRTIRDVCLPSSNWDCVAIQLESMCRIWKGTEVYTGLCNRRKDEARHIRRNT